MSGVWVEGEWCLGRGERWMSGVWVEGEWCLGRG